MQVTLDATPLLGVRTGIGRYVEQLSAALAGAPGITTTGAAFTFRGQAELRSALPGGVAARSRRVPARWLRAMWAEHEWPSARLLSGPSDVFHGTNFVLPPVGSRTAGVVTVHDLSFLRVSESVHADSLAYRELVPRSIRRSRRVLTPSRAVADEVMDEYRLSADQVTVTPLGVSDDWFAPPSPRPDTLPEEYFLAVGTLEPRKGLAHLVACHREMRAVRPDAPPLVLVGPPGWGTALDLSDADRQVVHLTGYLRAEELRSAVAHARCLVFPSTYEGFGLPPLEALAAGTPVIATDLPVTREVLADQAALVTGADELTHAMVSILDGAEAGTRASRQARARTFTWQGCATATIGAYRSAVDELGPPSGRAFSPRRRRSLRPSGR